MAGGNRINYLLHHSRHLYYNHQRLEEEVREGNPIEYAKHTHIYIHTHTAQKNTAPHTQKTAHKNTAPLNTAASVAEAGLFLRI